MKIDEIKQQLENTKADFYLNDRKGWFEAFEVREFFEVEDGEVDFYTLTTVEHPLACKNDEESIFYWVRIEKADWERVMGEIKDKEVEFYFIQGNNGYQDDWKLKIACSTDWAVYLEKDEDEE